jgi:hypothetical protein
MRKNTEMISETGDEKKKIDGLTVSNQGRH